MDCGPAEVVFSLDTNSDQPLKHKATLFRYSNGPVKVPGPWKRGRPRGAKQLGGVTAEKLRPQFEFVHISPQSNDIDVVSRTRIRRHAKLNQGRRGGLRLQADSGRGGIEIRDSQEYGRQFLGAQSKFKLKQISGVDPFDVSPFRLEPYMHGLLVFFSSRIARHLYSLEHLAGCNPLVEYWLPLAFQDAALLHCFIGCADVYSSGYQTIYHGMRGLRHMTAAITILNQRLLSPSKSIANGTLAMVAAIAMLEKGSGGHAHWQIHMKGLKRLVNMRGGLESLHSDPLILEKIYRADLYGSIDSTELPFFSEKYLLHTELSSQRSFYSKGFQAIQGIVYLDKTICACLHQLEDTMTFWSDAEGCFSDADNNYRQKKPSPADAARVRHLLVNIQYALVSVNFRPRTDGAEADHVSELCRVTLLLYTLTILNERPASTTFGKRISDVFRRTLAREASQSQDAARHTACTPWRSPLPVEFSLWAIVLAADVVRATESNTKTWLLASLRKLAASEGCEIRSWPELRSRLSKYLWVPSIHDALSQWVWSEAVGNARLSPINMGEL